MYNGTFLYIVYFPWIYIFNFSDTLFISKFLSKNRHFTKLPEIQWRGQPDIWSCKCKFFCVYRPYKEPISEEMNNDNHLNLHFHDQMSGWLRYCGDIFIDEDNKQRKIARTEGKLFSYLGIIKFTSRLNLKFYLTTISSRDQL